MSSRFFVFILCAVAWIGAAWGQNPSTIYGGFCPPGSTPVGGGGYMCLCSNGSYASGWPPSCTGAPAQPDRSQSIDLIPHERTLFPGYFGAIAYSSSSRAMGWSYDAKTQNDADESALNSCRSYGSGCQVVARFNSACGVLAITGQGGWGAATGANQPEAEHNAVVTCSRYGNSGCFVKRWVCTSTCNGCSLEQMQAAEEERRAAETRRQQEILEGHKRAEEERRRQRGERSKKNARQRKLANGAFKSNERQQLVRQRRSEKQRGEQNRSGAKQQREKRGRTLSESKLKRRGV